MAKTFLDPQVDSHELCFGGLKKKQPTKYVKKECTRCCGYGRWILERDAYGPGKHFTGFCAACWGWGYWPESQTCEHKWDGPGRNIGRCLNIWSCSKCGAEREVDSSD